jgi:hypothetical protein
MWRLGHTKCCGTLRGTVFFVYIKKNYTTLMHKSSDWRNTPEFVFTKLILQVLYWNSEIIIHSHIFILDLPASIDFDSGIFRVLLHFGGKLGCLQFVWRFGKMRDCLITIDNDGLWIAREKGRNPNVEIYDLRNLYITYKISKIIFAYEYQLCGFSCKDQMRSISTQNIFRKNVD